MQRAKFARWGFVFQAQTSWQDRSEWLALNVRLLFWFFERRETEFPAPNYWLS